MNHPEVKVGLAGLYELRVALQEVKKGMANRILGAVVRAAGGVVLKVVKAKAPVVKDSRYSVRGTLKKSFKLRVRKSKAGGKIAVIAPVHKKVVVRTTKGGKPIVQDPANIAHLVEYGHGGPGKAPEHTFVRAAWYESRGPAQAKANETARKEIAKLVKKHRSGKR